MSSQQTFRGGANNRGGPRRGGAGRGSSRRGGNGGYRNFGDTQSDRHISPDRRSMHSEDHVSHRFNNYRQPSRNMSRSPSPPNRQQISRGPFDGRSVRADQDSDRRRRSPDNRQMRSEDRTDHQSLNDRSARLDDRFIPYKTTNKETAREWKLRLVDAEEAVRHAEYLLRRAKIDLESTKDAYQEYTETTIPQELLMKKPAW